MPTRAPLTSHRKCISKFDLNEITERHKEEERIDGTDNLPAGYQEAVQATLETGEVVDPTKIEPVKKPRKSRVKKRKVDDDSDDEDGSKLEDTLKPKRTRKKTAIKEEGLSSEVEPEYILRKTRSRGAPLKEGANPVTPEIEDEPVVPDTKAETVEEEIDPNVLKIEAMAAAMREAAARG